MDKYFEKKVIFVRSYIELVSDKFLEEIILFKEELGFFEIVISYL